MRYYFKVKEGMLEPWNAWCELLMSNLRESAIATLREENLYMERAVLLEGGFILGESEGKGGVANANMERPINRLHRFMRRQCLERCEEVSAKEVRVLYELHGQLE